MQHPPLYPSLYQLNTRVWMTSLSQQLGRQATLDDIPDRDLDSLADLGFDWIYLLSVWQTGAVGRQISRTNPEWRKEFADTLPDLSDADIAGSGFAITSYTVSAELGGDAALARLRDRLRERGLRVMLDFVANHTAPDHRWVDEHPEFYIAGSESDLEFQPHNYTRVKDLILAYGRDPYFPGWPDTLQLNYSNTATQDRMLAELGKVAAQCDGVRCDMAMLLLPEVFQRTWGLSCEHFWPKATQRLHAQFPGFCFVAEVYWDLEWTIQQQGFDYTYDKRLYDRLRTGQARPVREHLQCGIDYQGKMVRFLENHDEPRAAAAFPQDMHEAAAMLTFLSPGMRFFHQGQLTGGTRRVSPHLIRAPHEPANDALQNFYTTLLAVLRRPTFRDGTWQLLNCTPAWQDNASNDAFIAFAWHSPAGEVYVIAVNYAPHQSQCYVQLPFLSTTSKQCKLRDLLSEACYDRSTSDLQTQGLYLDIGPWQYHLFQLT